MNISKKDMFWAWWPLASFLFVGSPVSVMLVLDKTGNVWPAWAGVGVFTVLMLLFLIDLGFGKMEYVKTEKRKELSMQKELEK